MEGGGLAVVPHSWKKERLLETLILQRSDLPTKSTSSRVTHHIDLISFHLCAATTSMLHLLGRSLFAAAHAVLRPPRT